MRRTTKALLLAFVLLFGCVGALAPMQRSEATDPLVMRGLLVLVKSIKRATADRAQAIGAVNAGRDENLRELEQVRAVADYFAGKGWITAEDKATVHAQVDQLQTGFEDLARRERNIVRHDTKFTRVLAENLRAEARLSAPQILTKLGVPEAAARIAGAAIQGEKPLSAVLDAAITKVTGGPLVEPTEDPLADLKSQLGSLREATDALRGTSKVKIAAELLGIQEKLEEIGKLPLPDQGAELGTLRRVIEEAEGTLAEAGAVRDEWLPKWLGPGNERFARDSKWQGINEEIQANAQSRIEGAIAAGMASVNDKRLTDALVAAGIEPTDEAIDDLRTALARATAEAWATGERPRADELIEEILGDKPAPDADPTAGATTAVATTQGTAEASSTEAPTPKPIPTAVPTPKPIPTTAPTTAPTPEPIPTAAPTAAPTPLPNRSGAYSFPLGAYAAQLSITFNFAQGAVSGSLSGTWTKLSGSVNCGQGSQVLDTAQMFATATFSSGFAGSVPPTGGAYSAPVGINGTIVYALTQPFTHPSCTSLNGQLIAKLPPSSSFTGSGTISGSAVADGPTSVNVDTTLGSYAQ